MPIINGTDGPDIYMGGSDSDTVTGKGGNDQLSGGAGNDDLSGDNGADWLEGGPGEDFLYSAARSSTFNLPYYGNPYVFPQVDIGSEHDTLIGGDGSDRLFAGYGDDVDGGTNGSYGDYLYISFLGAPSGITIDFSQPTNVVGGGAITGIENISFVQGSNFDDDINVQSASFGYSDFTAVLGMGGNDKLTAGYYTGTLFGGDGDDIVDGRPSQYLQSVDGGAGNDTLYTNSNTFASADGGDGNDTIYAHGLTHGGRGDDRIFMQFSYYGGAVYGDDGNDEIHAADSGGKIYGGNGADTVFGTDSINELFTADGDDMALDHDQLSGGGGDDTLSIGYGDDVDGGAGTDILSLSLGGLTSGIAFSTTGVVTGQANNLGGGNIKNIETLAYLRGTEFDDSLTIATQASQITVDGGAGNDTIIASGSTVYGLGGDGSDRFISGVAIDRFDGGKGTDTVDYRDALSGVTVALGLGGGQGSGAGDVLISIENVDGTGFNDTLTGNEGANVLSGFVGNDTLNGGLGADTLIGGAGNDTLDGGLGTDVAVFSGNRGNYLITQEGQDFRLIDKRAGANDGSDLAVGIEVFQFAGVSILASALFTYSLAQVHAGESVGLTDLWNVFGDSGSETITVGDHSFVTLRSGFNAGAMDSIRLTGQAADFNISASGSNAVLTSIVDDMTVTVPIGANGIKVIFDNDVTRTIQYVSGASFDVSPTQTVAGASNVGAISSTNSIGQIHAGESVGVSGRWNIFGDSGSETIMIGDHSAVTMRSGFNAGATDSIRLTGQQSNFSFSLSGSNAVLTSIADDILVSVPVGTNGFNALFDNGDSGTILFDGTKVIFTGNSGTFTIA